MKATFTDEQRALQDAARELAAGGRQDARTTLDAGTPPSDLTATLMADFGGVGVPESAGGLGGGLVDLAILLEALGRQVSPTPFVAHVLAVQAALGAGLDVADAVSSTEPWTLAVEEGRRGLPEVQTSVEDGRITGDKTAVRNGATCAAAVVATAGFGMAVASPSQRNERASLDTTRPLADLTFDGPAHAVSSDGAAAGVLRATAALAAEQVGVGRGALDLAVDYARTREQFGQPIGRFQGVSHQLADAFVGLELAWSLVLYACWAVDDGRPDAGAAVHRAKAKAGEAAVFACERGMQVHGGIGITWEADPHLYLRRAVADDAWLGPARRHRHWLGQRLVAAASS